MKKDNIINLLQNRLAILTIGPSTLRNQGAKDVISTSRTFLKKLKLSSFVCSSNDEFLEQLNLSTKSLIKSLPKNAQNWGAARKALNLFLRDVLYNHYLRKHYNFVKIEKYLELPLDSFVMDWIRNDEPGDEKLKKVKIKYLTPEISKYYQCAAKRIADKRKISRIQLDLFYWRS